MYFDRYDIVEAHYWYCANYHAGQGSHLYARLCRISRYFRPGPYQCGPSNSNALAIYDELVRNTRLP